MLAKDPDRSASSSSAAWRSRSERRADSKLPPDADAETLSERILALLEQDLFLPARDLAGKAVKRFPRHAGLKKLWRIFDTQGKSWVTDGGAEPSRTDEFEWLRNPPDWAQGKWVALIGNKAVAVGDTLQEVAKSVRAQELSRRPLVHRIG